MATKVSGYLSVTFLLCGGGTGIFLKKAERAIARSGAACLITAFLESGAKP